MPDSEGILILIDHQLIPGVEKNWGEAPFPARRGIEKRGAVSRSPSPSDDTHYSDFILLRY